jgi:NAD+ kinase
MLGERIFRVSCRSMKLNTVIITHKAGDRHATATAQRCREILEARGTEVLLGASGAHDNPYPAFIACSDNPIDLAVVLGGDGTALGAARHLAPEGIPILAVNIGGHLGFLAESVEDFDSETVWDRLLTDRYAIQKRMMLRARMFEGNDRNHLEPVSDSYLALNEMCIRPASADRMVTSILEMEIDGAVVDQYQGDGLIVATPTGSTCYTLAANGPIVHPGMEAIVITPICALSLSSRAIVIPPGSIVSVWALCDPDMTTKLWMDGVLATTLYPGQRVDISMAECDAQFIILRDNYSYYRTLQEKLHWGGSRIRHNAHRHN